MTPKLLSVIVPVYFNAQSLPHLFDELRPVEAELLALGVVLELVFVDDGSGDESWREITRIVAARPGTIGLRLSRNFGAVYASRTGLRRATGDAFLILAADLQDPPALIVEMAKRWLAGSKFVICVRDSRRDPWTTRLFAKFYYKALRFFVIKNYPEGGFDLALMDGAMLPAMRNPGRNVNPNVFAFWLGFKPNAIPYERRERKHGKSRWTFGKKFRFMADTILGFSVLPLRMMTVAGLFVAAASAAFGLFVVFNALFGRYEVQGFATLAALIAFTQGLLVGMVGLVGEYVWRIHDQVGTHPEAVVVDQIGLP